MFERVFRSGRVCRRLERNILADQLLVLMDHLGRRGHTRAVIRSYLQAVEHFGEWLRRTGHPVAEVCATTVKMFVAKHLPHCKCPPPCPRDRRVVRAALHQLLVTASGLPAPPNTARDGVIAGFERHLRDTCGLAPATRLYYRRYVGEFLTTCFGDGPIDLGKLALHDVLDYVSDRGGRLAPGSLNTVATSLRSFLRYVRLLGFGEARWGDAVPRAAQWRLATIPQVLSKEQIATLLSAFDRSSASGRRDYAIALCFTGLGLRASEVAAIRLDDIDWRASVLTVAAGKSRRVDRLPLPATVAAAVAAYLRRGRPATSVREVFVHHRAPKGAPLGATGVRGAMRRAYQRAGFDPRMTGTHVLRRTVATRLLRAGASMKEIADVLRHRALDSSAIYAKVDLPALRMVALPWPGVTP